MENPNPGAACSKVRRVRGSEAEIMKLAGFLLLIAGWLLVLAAVALLGRPLAREAFVLAAIAVEVLGLALMFYSHLVPQGSND